MRRARILAAVAATACLGAAVAGCSTDTAIGKLVTGPEAEAIARQEAVIDGYCITKSPKAVQDNAEIERHTRQEAEAAVDALADTLRAKPDAVFDSTDESRSRRVLRTDLEALVRALAHEGTPCDPALGARLQRALDEVPATTTG